jgi:hypothetical protein
MDTMDLVDPMGLEEGDPDGDSQKADFLIQARREV